MPTILRHQDMRGLHHGSLHFPPPTFFVLVFRRELNCTVITIWIAVHSYRAYLGHDMQECSWAGLARSSAQSILELAWALKSDPINKWVGLRLNGKKPEAQFGPVRICFILS